MASIKKLPSGKYYCQVRIKGPKPSYKSFSSLTDAQYWAKKREKIAQKDDSFSNATIKFNPEDTLSDIGIRYCSIVLMGKASQYRAHG